jgi:hypothetical protein
MRRQTLELVTTETMTAVKGALRPHTGPRSLPYKMIEIVHHPILVPNNIAEQAIMQSLHRMEAIPRSLIPTVKAIAKWKMYKGRSHELPTWSRWDEVKVFPTPLVTHSKAIYQGVSGNRTDGTQAPHFMPCQIQICNLTVDEFWEQLSFQANVVRGIYAAAIPMLTAVNKVDSLDEMMGLSELVTELHREVGLCVSGTDTPYQLALPGQLSDFQDKWVAIKGKVVGHLEEQCRTTKDPIRLEELEKKLLIARQNLEVLKSEAITLPESSRKIWEEVFEEEVS